MEKHNFNLYFNSFANGSHMRSSHFLNLCVNPKPPPQSPSSEDEEYSDRYKSTKKSSRSARSEISFAGDVTVTVTANVTTTTETKSWRNATVRQRSKRNRRKPEKPMITVSDFSPASSISDFSPEEDVARCLMMLSRDRRWKPNESEMEMEMEKDILNVKQRTPPARSRYRCDTCNRAFRSYQALGGHRASHKKIKLGRYNNIRQQQPQNVGGMGDNNNNNNKLHECPVCFKVFASGQALGGHKRSHVTAFSSSAITKKGLNLIDLNLPAPIEDDDDEVSQMEVSVVSDGRD